MTGERKKKLTSPSFAHMRYSFYKIKERNRTPEPPKKIFLESIKAYS